MVTSKIEPCIKQGSILINTYTPLSPNLDQEKIEFHILFVESPVFFSWVSQFSFIIGWQVCFCSVNPSFCCLSNINKPASAEQGWCSGESTRLPPVWPRFNPSIDAICGLSLLLVLSLVPRGFSPGTPVFPSPQKPTFPNSNSTRNQVDKEPLCGCGTCKLLFIYVFILFISSVWWFIQRSLGSARTDKPFIPCTLVAFSFVEMGWENGEYSC